MSRSWDLGGRFAPWIRHRGALATGIALCTSLTAATASGETPEGPDGLTDAPPRGTYVRVDDVPLVDPVGPNARDVPPHIVYLQRCEGGLELMPGAESSIDNTSGIIMGPVNLPPFSFGDEAWDDVVARTKIIFSPFNIEVTDEDPGAVPHDEAMVCGAASDAGFDGAGGVAPFSCGVIPNAITFTFPDSLGNSPQLIAEVIGQEVAHAWGLEHELLCDDPMTYLPDCGPKMYQDIDAECGEFDPRPCECGNERQNSFQHILEIFGPKIPDTEPPTIVITAPVNNQIVAPGEALTVVATIIDDSDVLSADLYANGELLEKDTLQPWGWQIRDLPEGIHTLEIVASDENGNQGLSTPVSLMVGQDPNEAGLDGSSGTDGGLGDTDTDTAGAADGGDGDKGCGCTQQSPDQPWLAVMPLLLALGWRRRAAR